MAAHIDVFVNDWSSALQRLVARVSLADGELHVETYGNPSYEEVVRRPIVIAETGEELHDFKTPDEFFQALPASFTGSYLSATPIHGANCPFSTQDVIPFPSGDIEVALG